MNIQTKKNDWLNEKFAKQPGMLVSGHTTFSEALGLDPSTTTVALRFIGNRNNIYCSILTISSMKNDWSKVKLGLQSSKAKTLLKRISNAFEFPHLNLVYDPLNQDEFSIFMNEDFTELGGSKLVEIFQKINFALVTDIGTYKEINKSINDSFQIWTRSHLSKYLTINDFDAISLDSKIIFEFKRVQESIDTWHPYVDDAPNYLALLLICRLSDFKLRVIAYQEAETRFIGLHTISDVNTNSIKGRFVNCRAEDVMSNLIGIEYTSNKRRQAQRY